MAGEDHAWQRLGGCDPAEVCMRAAVTYSREQGYGVPVFGFPIYADPETCTLSPSGPETELFLNKMAYFSRLSVLFYLLDAQSLSPTGRLLKPAELKTGQLYSSGSHILPLDPVASRFASDPEGFLAQGARFGGEPRAYGDAAVELLPLPRVPITMILWEQDDEFAARCSLLFDAVCELQVPPDILWSVAMMSALVMLRG